MSDTDKNVSINVSISGGEVPQKESVIWRFLVSFSGAMAFLTTVDITRVAIKKGENVNLAKKDTLITLGLNAVGATLFGLYDSHKAAERNKHIDDLTKQQAESHTKRYEQEKLISSQSPQIPSR